MKQIAWDEVMKRLEVASKICNDASPVQVEGPIHIGVDLGTADVVVMAVDDNGMPVSAFLEWATVVRDGVVVDYHGAITIVKRLVSMTEERLGRKITEASTSYPPGTDARLSINILDAANLRLVSTADEPSCLARLARLDRAAVVDIGGGTSEVAVISLGGIVSAKSVRVGGDEFDSSIINYVKRAYNLLIGERTAEMIKIEIGSASSYEGEGEVEIKGRDLADGLPKNISLSAKEVREALAAPLQEVVDAIKTTLEKTPPELASDIIDHGITLTGGGALLRGLDELVTRETGMPVHIAENPLDCVAEGTGKVLENLDLLKEVLSDDGDSSY